MRNERQVPITVLAGEEIESIAERGATTIVVPLIIRGKVITDDLVEFRGRHGGLTFSTPDVRRHLHQLPLENASALRDYYLISLDDILDFLVALGSKLDFRRNVYLQEAFHLSVEASGLTEPILRNMFENGLQRMFHRPALEEIIERNIGRDYLEGWVATPLRSGALGEVRAFGARGIHIVPGNAPLAVGVTVIRCAVTRSDAVIKSPSNDPMTHAAVIRTMIDLDPNHPVTRHFSVGYWKGGDEKIERVLYHPKNVEKIVAWGGMNSIKHIVRYLQPGIDLITLEPKFSSSIIGRDAFTDEATMRKVAHLLAIDVGGVNQEGCANARVVYADTGTDEAGLGMANRFAEYVYQAMLDLPTYLSTKPKDFDVNLAGEIDALKLDDTFYRVVGGDDREGAVIVSQMSEPVDFARILSGRVANIVPMNGVDTAIGSVNSYTQTIGVYPDHLKDSIRDNLGIQGAQRVVSLGFALAPMLVLPQDGLEPLRRMCRWVAGETASLGNTTTLFDG
jgi:Acyl-CoA reductase (LuxC)